MERDAKAVVVSDYDPTRPDTHQGDKGTTGREAFMWPPGTAVHHLYIVVAGSKPHRAAL